MNSRKVYDDDGKGFTRVFSGGKVEKVDPIEFYTNHELNKRAVLMRDHLNMKNPVLTATLDKEFFMKQAKESMQGFMEEYEKTPVHPDYLKLLETTKKKEQIRLLKGISLDTGQLMSLIMKSHRDFGYLYSKYLFENLPKNFEGRKLPKLFNINDDGSIHKVGETDLSDGEMRQLIHNRKVVASHFFERGDIWHCFFITYKSISGKESWKGGQAHFHYISSAFGYTKEEFVESMRTGKYLSTSVHIDILDYGNQPEGG